MTFRLITFGGALALIAATAAPAFAQRAVQSPSAATAAPTAAPEGMENAFVYGGDFATHVQAEVAKVGDKSAKGTAFDDTDSNFYANYSTWLSVYGNLHLERNRGTNANSYFPEHNSAFRSEGLTARQLFAAVRPTNDLSVYGGKIHPNFGSAFAEAPGNFYNFGSDYEQSERIGFGVEYRLPAWLGLENARLSVETYFLDTSPLSRSLISQPKLSEFADGRADRARRYTRDQFGPSNTGGLDSWTVSLRGGQPETGLTYQVSWESQATSDPAGKTEHGGSIGMAYDPSGGDGIPLGHRLGVVPFVEYAQFSNFGNADGQNNRYLIGGLAFHYVRWELDVTAGIRRATNVALDDGTTDSTFDRQQSISLNYRFTPHLTAGVGINHIDVSGQGSSWSGGPSASYEMSF